MPIYEYVCKSCHRRIEKFQKINDPPLKKCRDCSGKLQKIISSSGIMFKGSGWYVTDYSNKFKSKEKDKPKDQKETKTEEKPKPSEGGKQKSAPSSTKSDSSKKDSSS